MAGKFYAEGTAVRFSNGKPCCVTTGSTHLDAGPDGVVETKKMREALAIVIAKALNTHYAATPTPAPSLVGYGLFDETGKMLAWTDNEGFATATWKPDRVRPLFAGDPEDSPSSSLMGGDIPLIADLQRHVEEIGHTEIGQDITAAIDVIRSLSLPKAAYSNLDRLADNVEGYIDAYHVCSTLDGHIRQLLCELRAALSATATEGQP